MLKKKNVTKQVMFVKHVCPLSAVNQSFRQFIVTDFCLGVQNSKGIPTCNEKGLGHCDH
jgi:hypothetical protein